MAKTNGMNIISDPWVYPEDKHGTGVNGSPINSPIFKNKKKTTAHAGIFSHNVHNPEEIDLEMVSVGHKTGMQAVLSDVIDQKAKDITRRNNDFLTSLGMRAVQSKSKRGVSLTNHETLAVGRGNTDLGIGVKFGKAGMARTFAQTPSRQHKEQFGIDRKLMKDNPSSSHVGDIGRYIKQLDFRLSIPKFTKESDLTENQKLFKIGTGIKNEISQLRKSKGRSGSVSPDGSPRKASVSPNAQVMHQMSGGDLQRFIKKTARINSTERGAIPATSKEYEAVQLLASVDSSKLVIQKSQMERERSRQRLESLKKVPVE